MNLNLLRFYIVENKDTMHELAKALDLHYNTLSLKLTGKREFTQSEIKIITQRYSLSGEQVIAIFF